MSTRYTVAIVVKPVEPVASSTVANLVAHQDGWHPWHIATVEADNPNDAAARVLIRDFAWRDKP